MITGPGWAEPYIKQLKEIGTSSLTVFGSAMDPLLKQGDVVQLRLPQESDFVPGRIVLCRCGGRDYLHRIEAVKLDKIMISDNKGFSKGSTTRSQIFAVAVSLTRDLISS